MQKKSAPWLCMCLLDCTYTRKIFLYNPSFDLKLIPLYTNSYEHLQMCHRRGFCSNRFPETVLHKPQNVPPRLEHVNCLAQTCSVSSTNKALRGTKICMVSSENRVQLHWSVGLWPPGRFGVRVVGLAEGHHPWTLTIVTERSKHRFNPKLNMWRHIHLPGWGNRWRCIRETELWGVVIHIDTHLGGYIYTDRWEARAL